MGKTVRMARLRTIKIKTIYDMDEAGRPVRHISTRLLPIEPDLFWPASEDESPYPASKPLRSIEGEGIGIWRRMVAAVKRFGLDGDEE